MTGFAVIDLETTGFAYNHTDRVCEISTCTASTRSLALTPRAPKRGLRILPDRYSADGGVWFTRGRPRAWRWVAPRGFRRAGSRWCRRTALRRP